MFVNRTIVQFRREYNGSSGRTQMLFRRIDHDEVTTVDSFSIDDLECKSFTKISSAELNRLLDELHVPYANLNRLLIKQNATSIASTSSNSMLEYVRSSSSAIRC
mmetsp:Transcript_12726/g.20691  ORF Transcript_12726/g.20691 Transcript_12726/m.20691 type:complete len:105 (+) Transcript_12726:1329-1643(+)